MAESNFCRIQVAHEAMERFTPQRHVVSVSQDRYSVRFATLNDANGQKVTQT